MELDLGVTAAAAAAADGCRLLLPLPPPPTVVSTLSPLMLDALKPWQLAGVERRLRSAVPAGSAGFSPSHCPKLAPLGFHVRVAASACSPTGALPWTGDRRVILLKSFLWVRR